MLSIWLVVFYEIYFLITCKVVLAKSIFQQQINFNHIYITSILISSIMLLSFKLLISIRVMNNTIIIKANISTNNMLHGT